MTITDALALAIVVATLAGILTRPRGIGEAWFAAAGGLAMVLVGAVGASAVRDEIGGSADILLFLLGMMALTSLVERAGVFEHLAEAFATWSRGSGGLLFANVFILGTIVTTLLSLDVMVIVITPIVYTIAMRRRIDPLPFMFACAFIANTGSLMLPISNLTNLLVYHELDIGFIAFARVMWLPNLAAVLANFLVFRWLFRSRIPRRFTLSSPDPLPPTDWWFWTSAATLSITLAGLFALGLTHRPLAIAALGGAAALLAIAVIGKRAGVVETGREVSWTLFLFVIGMVLVVRGVEPLLLAHVGSSLPTDPLIALLSATGVSALGSNIVNNVPMTLLGLSVIAQTTGKTREAFAYGLLVGSNIGPTLTTYGSLATMLWLTAIRKRGLEVSTGQYLRVGLVTMPLVLLAATLALLAVR